MSLKAFVADRKNFEEFKEHLEGRIKAKQSILETSPDRDIIFRCQGAIDELRRLMKLDEELKYKDTSHG